jgi:hypothetical protein
MTLALHMLQRVNLQKFEGSRPAGLGEVVVRALLAPQQPLFPLIELPYTCCSANDHYS